MDRLESYTEELTTNTNGCIMSVKNTKIIYQKQYENCFNKENEIFVRAVPFPVFPYISLSSPQVQYYGVMFQAISSHGDTFHETHTNLTKTLKLLVLSLNPAE